MNLNQLKEDVLRAEGYAEGFRAGYISCAQKVANELEKEKKVQTEESKSAVFEPKEG